MGENDDTNVSDEALASLLTDALDAPKREAVDQPQAEPRLLSIDEVAQRTDLTKPTLRFYEQRGLVEPPPRPPRKFRKYSPQDVERLEHVKQLRDLLGLSLNEIEETLRIDKERKRLAEQVRAQWRATQDATVKQRWVDEAMRLDQQAIEDANLQLRAVDEKLQRLETMRAEILERIERTHGARGRLEASQRGLGEAK